MKKKPVFVDIQRRYKISGEYPEAQAIHIGQGKHRKTYLQLYCGYDVETTTARTPNGWRSAVYSHALTIANDKICYVYMLRKWEEILELIEKIIEFYKIDENNRLIVWVANLSYEFSFLEHRFQWTDVFAKESLQPLLAHSNGIEFREALTISGGGLAHLAKTFCHTQKLLGELDYKKQRNYSTLLTSAEKDYIANDVIILAEFSFYIFKNYIKKYKYIPMTKTGILSNNIKRSLKAYSKKLTRYGNAEEIYRKYIQDNFPEKNFYYYMFRYIFRGGYVHANALYTGIETCCDMYDITSSYPAVMLLDYVPAEKFTEVPYSKKYLRTHCCIAACTFENIRTLTTHTIESKNKIIDYENAIFDNGRLISADKLCVFLTEIDLEIYNLFYKWDSLKITNFQIARRGKLPKFLLNNLISDYTTKTALKKKGLSDSIEYKLAKERVNSHYGLCVKRIRLEKNTFDNVNGWTTEETPNAFENEREKAYLLPQWGLYITAHARRRLLYTVKALENKGVKVVYCDTDSIKFIPNKKAFSIIKNYNAKIRRRLYNRGYRSEMLKGIGEFSHECEQPQRFKTLGAKRYITEENGKVVATVAGMPKTSIYKLGNNEQIFDKFNLHGFILTPEKSNKLTTSYTHEKYSLYIDGEWLEEKSGCALYEIPFTLSLKDEYITVLKGFQELKITGGAF